MILDKSFCCFSLQTGGYIIGWLNVCSSIFGFIASIVTIALISTGTIVNCDDPDTDIEKCDQLRTMLIAIFTVVLIFTILGAAPSVLLLYGISKNRRNYLRPWLFFAIFQFIGLCVNLIMTIQQEMAAGIFGAIIGLFVNGYIYMCIYSLYKVMGESQFNNLYNRL